ncbi:lysophospholipid acyltransferase family protein [Sphingomonas sp.]|jgi:1-acyl-sn-glycerol-3-phosphate acyltransferase|uniref:lysophospholipid acyltransferase family protein n=1 Tax=Sphingomonas sp. TaxID=28214 RepID=UPI002DE54F90|nr:lysophospholipid acyltransferase family protein [Sphingomonas sp.]
MNRLRTLIFQAIFYSGSVGFVLLAPVSACFGEGPLTRVVYGWARFHDWCTRRLLGIGWRLQGEIPSGPVIVAMKHEAMYETIQALLLLDRPGTVFKRELMNIPVWGPALRRFGGIVVDRDAGSTALRAMLAEGKALIEAGRPILIFPEGTRVPPGQRPELKSGLSGLYRMLKLPVVPIACDSGRLLPKKGLKHPGVVTFKVGETIPPGLPREELEARVHAAINALNG